MEIERDRELAEACMIARSWENERLDWGYKIESNNKVTYKKI